MRTHNDSFLQQIKIRSLFIALMVLSIILSLAFLFYYSNRNRYEERVVVNVVGRQRMLTQTMAKDASRLYALMQAEQTGNMVQSKDIVESKIKAARSSLLSAKLVFSRTLTDMNNGYIESGKIKIYIKDSNSDMRTNLQEVNEMWVQFSDSIDIVLNSSSLDVNVANATIYINDNNLKLLEYCDSMLQNIVNDARTNIQYVILLSIFFVGISFVIICFAIFHLNKYMIMPLNEIYKGFSEIGVYSGKKSSMRPLITKRDVQPIVVEIGSMFEKVEKLISLIENINNNLSFGEVLQHIFNSFSPFVPYNYIGVAIAKENGLTLEASYGISDGAITDLPEGLSNKEYNITGTSLEKVLITGEARVINDLELYSKNKAIREYTQVILKSGIRSSITLPLRINNKLLGAIFFSSKDKNVYTNEHIDFLRALANSIAISFEKNIFVDDLLYSSLLALAKLAEARDEDTAEHLERMKKYSRLLAELLYADSKYKDMITPEYINDIERFSPMHDIGKVSIRDGILIKPGKLTPEEFEEMKTHTLIGSEVLKTAENNIARNGRSVFKLGIEIAEAHHEKWNGSGYPYGKKEGDIPLSARIVAVADVFDALTSKRPYKEPYSFETSFAMIVEGKGKHFDPEMIRVLQKNKKKLYRLYQNFNTGSQDEFIAIS